MEAPNFNADGNVDAGAENREVSVVIPMYTTQLNDFEVLSVRRTFDVLRDHDIVIIKPQSLDLQPLDQLLSGANCRVESFEDAYFQGRTGYNRLMMSPTFYERFLSSRYILICQTDVFIFSDRLLDWCKKDYDYAVRHGSRRAEPIRARIGWQLPTGGCAHLYPAYLLSTFR